MILKGRLNMEKVESGIYKNPLVLDKCLEDDRNTFEKLFIKAQRRLKAFAAVYGWEDLLEECFINRAFIFSNQSGLFDKVVEITGADKDKLPSAFSGIILNKEMLIISPSEYERIYFEGIEENSYEKLITHELAHELHIRILNGQEELMGPIWFFEGFAIFAAEQLLDYKLSEAEIWKVVKTEERISYKYYASIIKYFLTKTSLNQLVENAGKEGFLDWLNNL
jgi:hypothetical protein